MVLSHWKQLSEDRYTGHKSMDMGINKLNLNIILFLFLKNWTKLEKVIYQLQTLYSIL